MQEPHRTGSHNIWESHHTVSLSVCPIVHTCSENPTARNLREKVARHRPVNHPGRTPALGSGVECAGGASCTDVPPLRRTVLQPVRRVRRRPRRQRGAWRNGAGSFRRPHVAAHRAEPSMTIFFRSCLTAVSKGPDAVRSAFAARTSHGSSGCNSRRSFQMFAE